MRNENGLKIEQSPEQQETEPKIDFVGEYEKRIIDSEPLEETKSIIVNNQETIKIIKNVPAIVFLFNRELELWIKDVQDVYAPHYLVEADLRSTIRTPPDDISVWCDGFIIVDNKKIRYLLLNL